MTPLNTELQHLISLMAPPFREHWKAYCWTKANILAESNPQDYQDLPARLKEAMSAPSSPSEAPGTESSPTMPPPPSA